MNKILYLKSLLVSCIFIVIGILVYYLHNIKGNPYFYKADNFRIFNDS
jgi:hypothetical protein